jgi:arylsulfatase A-like enzyme
MDDGVGRILKALEDRTLSDDTLVVFFSDNGGERLSDNSPLFHGKYSLWEGGVRVPCVLSWPTVLPKGHDSSQPSITMDLTATLLKAAGAKMLDNLDGIDLVPILIGTEKPKDRTLFWRLPRPDSRFGQKAARNGSWKYIEDRETELLFDLANDIGERKNLAYRHPDIVKEIKDLLAKWEATLPALSEKK